LEKKKAGGTHDTMVTKLIQVSIPTSAEEAR